MLQYLYFLLWVNFDITNVKRKPQGTNLLRLSLSRNEALIKIKYIMHVFIRYMKEILLHAVLMMDV